MEAVLNGRKQALRIVGVALSPEYVLQIREGELIPDEKRFGVFWMHREELAAAFDMDGAFNNVVGTLLRGASEKEVLARIDDLTEPYGGVGAYGRSDQLSHRYLSDEMAQLRGMGIVAPTIFFSVAAFLLNVVLTRLIRIQREQIAALKAFGYNRFEVGWHYLQFVLLITVVGLVLGTIGGVFLGRNLTVMYTRFYKFPHFQFLSGIPSANNRRSCQWLGSRVGHVGISACRHAIAAGRSDASRAAGEISPHTGRTQWIGKATLAVSPDDLAEFRTAASEGIPFKLRNRDGGGRSDSRQLHDGFAGLHDHVPIQLGATLRHERGIRRTCHS